MDDRHAVLLDTVSIQEYVFQSNRLKENLGASHLVQEVYRTCMTKTLKEIFPDETIDTEAWKNGSACASSIKYPCDIGYIGGGNALLFFREKAKAEEFVKNWTRRLLVEAPGIVTAVALSKFDADDFKNERDRLFRLLRDNKSTYSPQTTIPRHGITGHCSRTGLSLDVWNNDPKASGYVSSVANSKIEAAKKARDSMNERYGSNLKKADGEFRFPVQFEHLGRLKGEESHIAVVHIDGNDMGERFKNIGSLDEVRRLSVTVNDATFESFCELVGHVVEEYRKIMDSLGFDPYSKDAKRWYPTDEEDPNVRLLPILPIILGGDDLTFVCDGRLGLYFAKYFMEKFAEKTASDGLPLSCCAGVAITKTSYPFYRGYRLSEQLCRNAKKARKENGDKESYLDFHVSSGGISGDLDVVREKNYKAVLGSLLYRPYKLTSDKDPRSFDLCVKNAGELRNFPNNKIYELRRIMTLSERETRRFVEESRHRGRKLPEIPDRDCARNLFCGGETPYFDMIELMEYYPDFAWRKEKDN